MLFRLVEPSGFQDSSRKSWQRLKPSDGDHRQENRELAHYSFLVGSFLVGTIEEKAEKEVEGKLEPAISRHIA